MSKRKTGKVPRAQTVSENDSYYAPVSLVQKERGKVAKICPFDASAFLGLLDDDDSDEIDDDKEDNIKIHGQKANWVHFVQKEQAKMFQSCPFFAPFLGIPDDSGGAIKSVSDDEEDQAIQKVSSAQTPSPMDLQGAVEDKPFQHYADKFERSPKHTPYCNNPTLGDLLLQGKCYLFHQPSVGWQMPQFDFPLWMFKCWYHSHGQLGTTPLICSLTMPRYKLLALTLFASP
ncbi:unnamed protein product [Cylindrotheca closterium]|uniref:Uncharacterized protein n=1 Tax=Cylindrotheca closterium TaxID=2856 RepID=A0AAD2G808_9STRA|nr:unnamed protein product [Cylindrotheca closterium]